jgi:AraC-like DNA-binding protein
MDPLSDVLALLKPTSYAFRGLDAGNPWAIEFPPDDGIKCYALTSGTCWLHMDVLGTPLQMSSGDFLLLPRRHGFRFASGPDAPSVDAIDFFGSVPPGEFAVLNGGGDCSGVGGYFGFSGLHTELLLGVLPPVVHLRSDQTKAAVRGSIDRMMRELRDPQPGSSLLAGHLAQTLLIEALRLHLADGSRGRAGWLFALADKQMRSAIDAMHARPEQRWTLEALADSAGMSRSSFAARFRATVGEPPMEYLTRWRMLLAADKLVNNGATISAIAPALGYDSDSAFGAAFKRVFGCSPRKFVRQAA